MRQMHVYRRRDGDYILVPCPSQYDGVGDGVLYLGVIAAAAFGAELHAWIVAQLAEHEFAQLTPRQFFGR